MLHAFSRTELLLGADGMARLAAARVALFGVGGVGSYAAEALARSGIGGLVLVDDDRVCLTNLNRQLHATHRTVGQLKAEAMKARLLEINPKLAVEVHPTFYLPGKADELLGADLSYVIDAIDTVTAKIDLVLECQARGLPIVSCMGAGNKLDATRFEVADIYSTSVCPLARVMRRELRRRGVPALKVVYSREEPVAAAETEASSCNLGCVCPKGSERVCTERRSIPGSVAFVPAVAGLILAGEVVRDLAGCGRSAAARPS